MFSHGIRFEHGFEFIVGYLGFTQPSLPAVRCKQYGHPVVQGAQQLVGLRGDDAERFQWIAVGCAPQIPQSGENHRPAVAERHSEGLFVGVPPFVIAVRDNEAAAAAFQAVRKAGRVSSPSARALKVA